MLKSLGFSEAKLNFICICSEDGRKFEIFESAPDFCSECGSSDFIQYYYLGLKEKCKLWFKNKSFIEDLLTPWSQKSRWINNSSNNSSSTKSSELWDRLRWKELSFFWDPMKTFLSPQICVYCEKIFRSTEASNATHVTCSVCGQLQSNKQKQINGNPFNIALVAHWDGWQPFRSSNRGSGSLEISIGNLPKSKRCTVEEVYVLGFVPIYCLNKHNLDPFLLPFMKELEECFLDGIAVELPKQINIRDHQLIDDTITIRIILLLFTGDHPVQCEVGKFLTQGRSGCRRCKISGIRSSNRKNPRLYYGNTRYHCRYPPESRTLDESVHDMELVEAEDVESRRKILASLSGFTGCSVLHTYLNILYDFNVIRDFVFDTFHTISLNLIKNTLNFLIKQDHISVKTLDEEIGKFPWTPEYREGRLPVKLKNKEKSLSSWKAEAFKNFGFPMLEVLLDHLITNSKVFELVSSVARITKLHFYRGRSGWSEEMIHEHQTLAKIINVLGEECFGLEYCTVSIHNLLHLHEDVIFFGSTDNYWCATFERAVKNYVSKAHNSKNMEKTFAMSECRREFLKFTKKSHGKNEKFNFDNVDKSIVSSKAAGMYYVETTGMLLSLLVGSRNIVTLSNADYLLLRDVCDGLEEKDLAKVVYGSKRAYIPCIGREGAIVREGEYVHIENESDVFEVVEFFSVKNYGGFQVVAKVLCYEFAKDQNGVIEKKFLSGYGHVDFRNGVTRFVSADDIARELIIVPANATLPLNAQLDPNAFSKGSLYLPLEHFAGYNIVVDFMRCEADIHYSLVNPIYVEVRDVVRVQGEIVDDAWIGEVIEKEGDHVYTTYLVKRAGNLYVRESRNFPTKIHMNRILEICYGIWCSEGRWLMQQ